MKEKPYFAGLDILRLFASIAVFIWHIQESFWGELPVRFNLNGELGNLAVGFFFTLSGFLLSYLLFSEFQQTNNIAIRAFFMRRILRIWPLYFIMVTVGFFIYPFFIKLLTDYEIPERASLWRYCLFIPNYDVIISGSPVSPALGVMWSLGVEEQFYVFLPFFVLAFIWRRRIMTSLLLVFLVFSLWYKTHVLFYYDTLSVMFNLLFGIMISILAFYRKDRLKKTINKHLLLLAFIIFVTYCITLQLTKLPGQWVIPAKCLELLCYGLFILNFSFYPAIRSAILRNKVLSFLVLLGKRYTYSIYLMHEFALMIATLLVHQWLHFDSFILYTCIAVTLISLIVWLAFRYIEEPILSLKEKFAILT